jgi:gamma-aminobutyric acid receptor subunit alpha
MLVMLSWVSFFINREATSDRTCIGIMCVLSLATLSFDVRNDIPSVAYVTALDWFLMMCYLFIFASLLEFTLVHYFTKTGYGDFINIENLDLSNSNIAQFIRKNSKDLQKLNHIVALDALKNSDQTRVNKGILYVLSSFWKCMTNDPDYKKHIQNRAHARGINSVSSIDEIARKLFPITFLILNIIYWYIYYIKG